MIVESRPLRTTAEVPDVPRPPSWTEQALCASHPEPDLWFGEMNETRKFQKAREVCSRCPVLEKCREAGKGEPYGVWAGEMHHPLLTTAMQMAREERIPTTYAVPLCRSGMHERTRENVYPIRNGSTITFGCRDCDRLAA